MIDRSQRPSLHSLEEYDLPATQCHELPNGVKLWLLDAADVEVTRIDLVFHAGTLHQSQLLQALFTNRMLREGTRQLDQAQIAEKLDYYGAWLEQSVSFQYSFVTVYTLNKYLEPVIALLEQMIKEPNFDAQALEVVKQNNLQRHLEVMQQPSTQARRLFMRSVYGPQHIMGQYAEAADYQSINACLLQTFHHQHYHHDNLSIYLAGHITNHCLDLIAHTFGQPFGGAKVASEATIQTVPLRPATKQFKEMPGTRQSSVLIGKSTIGLQHPDCLPLRVLVTLLGGYFGSRLMMSVREKKGLTYGIYALLNPSDFDNTLMILSDCDHRFVQPLLEETYHQIDRLQKELVSADELALLRSSMKGDMLRAYDSRLALTDAWIYLHTHGLPSDYYHRMWQVVSSITPQELQRLACTYLNKDTLTEVVAGEKMS
ncbi:MAG: insulinase family protein [Bacteroidaceae bacterium]|nr:insulinase family protein [Bacteroidaceae bacterium]